MNRGIVDLSSVIWTCLLAGKDREFGREVDFNGKKAFINSANFGYENAINHLKSVMQQLNLQPRDLILVMEGMNSKAERQAIHAGYKSGRDKPPEQYEQFNLCKEKLINSMLGLGANLCWQDGGVEADDVVGYLAKYLKGNRWIISGDKDLAAAIALGPGISHLRNGDINLNPFGPFKHEHIPVWIALVGDSGDKIPGASGFGQKAGEELLIKFGNDGLELMGELIRNKQLKKLEEDLASMPKLQKIIDDAPNVYMSYELARLRIEKVNTVRRPLSWRAGMVTPRANYMGDDRLLPYAGVTRLVCAENYTEALKWMRHEFQRSPFVTLDIETSTPPESDEWLELQGKEDKVVDVFGSRLTGMSLTFGPNMQYTVYLTHKHVPEPDVTNLTIEQVSDVVNAIPREKFTIVHNASFELSVCYREWGARPEWKDDPDYHGFLRNVIDTVIMSSYADENRSKGLKSLSKTLLNYEQESYEHVTTSDHQADAWDGKGKVVARWNEKIERGTGKFYQAPPREDPEADCGYVNGEVGPEIMEEIDGPEWVRVQRKMDQLTARHVLSYGADDAICTAALATHFTLILEIEDTWDVFMEVEQFPAYLTSLAFVQGTDFSLESMREQEKEDDEAYAKAEPILHDYLMKIGYEGTQFVPITELTPAEIKRAVFTVLGREMAKTMVRTPSKLAKLIEQEFDEEGALLAQLVSEGAIDSINKLMESKFVGKPNLDLASPKQMTALLYDYMKLPVHIINDVTLQQKIEQPQLFDAIRKFKQIRAGKQGMSLTDEEKALVRKKAKSDDTAIDFALAFDTAFIDDEARAALKAIGVMKKVMTRRSLFYKNYWHVLHWADNKIHASANQCAADTRRYSMSNPNLQQLPKKGAGVKFRGNFKPHKKNAVVASIDFVGQELRLAAQKSQDKNMLACYVGDNLKDIHSITAAGAMRLKWGPTFVNELFEKYGADIERGEEAAYQLFVRLHKTLGKSDPIAKKADDLRKEAKNVNFGAQNGARAQKLAETLIMKVEDAQLFLDARQAMFPDVDKAAEAAADKVKATGCAFTLMGARRHLREAMLSDDRGAADRAARQAWNFEIQGSAGEMTKLAMSRLWKSGIYFKYDARFIAPIHDELVSSVTADDAVEFLREKNWCMTQPYSTMTVPILGSISIGKDFAKQEECGDWFIKENIEKALKSIFPEGVAA